MMSRRRRSTVQGSLRGAATTREAAIWIDYGQALIVERGPGRQQTVELLDRQPGESEVTFDARTVDRVLDDDRVVVSGPPTARLDFERAYVAVTHRPDRLMDVEPKAPVGRSPRRTP